MSQAFFVLNRKPSNRKWSIHSFRTFSSYL